MLAIITRCRDDTSVQTYYQQIVARARKRLIQYPLLRDIFDDFDSYEYRNYRCSKNVVFLRIIKNSEKDNILKDVERSISIFRKLWIVSEYEQFIRRLTSTESFTSNAAITEILTAYEIGMKIGFDDVDIHHKLLNGKKPDVFFKIKDQEVCLELTTLNSRESETKIERILTYLADFVVQKCNHKNYTMLIYLDTIHFKFNDEGNIDEEASKNFLQESVEKIALCDLTAMDGKIEIFRIPKSQNSIFLSDLIELKTQVPGFSFAVSDQQRLNLWAMKIRIDDLYDCPFESISIQKNEHNECVMIQTREFDTNDSAMEESRVTRTSRVIKRAFLKQVSRAIGFKISEEQYWKGKPTIIGVRINEWRYDIHDHDDFVEMKNHIQKQLTKYPFISGVFLYNEDLYHGRYIENSIADSNVKIMDTELVTIGIINKYIEPLLTNDKQVNFSALNDSQQESRIKDLIKLEPKITLNQDKLELLSETDIFLKRSSIDSDFLRQLKPIIQKYCDDKDPDEDDIDIPAPLDEKKYIILGIPGAWTEKGIV